MESKLSWEGNGRIETSGRLLKGVGTMSYRAHENQRINLENQSENCGKFSGSAEKIRCLTL